MKEDEHVRHWSDRVLIGHNSFIYSIIQPCGYEIFLLLLLLYKVILNNVRAI